MIWINTDINKHFLDILAPGLRVILYTEEELEVEAIVHFEKDELGKDWWYGIPDWETMRDL